MRTTAARVWLALTLFMLYGALAPFQFRGDRAIVAQKLAGFLRSPFTASPDRDRAPLPDVTQNVLFFLPFGAVGVLALRRRHEAPRPSVETLVTVMAIAGATGATFEAAQLFTPERTSSIVDIVANVLGAAVGAAITFPAIRFWDHSPRAGRTKALVASSGFRNFAAVSLLLCAAAWRPFDATLDVSSVVGNLRALRANAFGIPSAGVALAETVRGVLFGVLTVRWLRQEGVPGPTPWAVALGLFAAMGLATAQLLVQSRQALPAEALLLALSGAAGAGIARLWPRRTSTVVRLALAGATLGAAWLEMSAPMQPARMAEVSRLIEAAVLAGQLLLCVTALQNSV